MRLLLAAVRNDALIICMRLLTVTIRTRAIYRIQILASLSDEDAVYLIESVVQGLHICKRVFARAFNLHTKTEMMTAFCFHGIATHNL